MRAIAAINRTAEPQNPPPKKAKNLATTGPSPAPLESMFGSSYPYHFLASGQELCHLIQWAMPGNGGFTLPQRAILRWTLLHNFFLECGARAKMRVYEMTADHARAMIGYLSSAAAIHRRHAKALEKLTGADVGRLLPILMSATKFPEAMKHEANGCTRSCGSLVPGLQPTGSNLEWPRTRRDGQELVVGDEMPQDSPGPKTPKSPSTLRARRDRSSHDQALRRAANLSGSIRPNVAPSNTRTCSAQSRAARLCRRRSCGITKALPEIASHVGEAKRMGSDLGWRVLTRNADYDSRLPALSDMYMRSARSLRFPSLFFKLGS
jgi:hypothetical protein